MLENQEEIIQAIYNDLHKHRLESNIGEISAVVEDANYMIKVHLSLLIRLWLQQ